MTKKTLGIYVHIPFCRSKCDYCDFYSLAGCDEKMDHYQSALLSQIRETAPGAADYLVDTIYFGGGTPSYYGAKRLIEVLKLIFKLFNVSKQAEITVECNPDSVDFKKLRSLRRAGVNRISMGMQSGNDCELRDLNRPHNSSQVKEAVDIARRAKIKNINLDLIFGLPGQTKEGWAKTLDLAIGLNPEHLSCYSLIVEDGTPLAKRIESGLSVPDDDLQADLYLWTVERLNSAGYAQYEISNFAKTGFRSRHNLKYWMGEEYLGFGASSHSDFGNCRYAFVSDLENYTRSVEDGSPLLSESEIIPQRERSSEYLMLRLRTVHGIEEWEYRRKFYMNFTPLGEKLKEYQQKGWSIMVAGRWRFTPEGFLLSNQLIGELLDLQESATLADTLQNLDRIPRSPAEEF